MHGRVHSVGKDGCTRGGMVYTQARRISTSLPARSVWKASSKSSTSSMKRIPERSQCLNCPM